MEPCALRPPGGPSAVAAAPRWAAGGLRAQAISLAAALSPLAMHRVLEQLAQRAGPGLWARASLHTLPPLGMLGTAVLLWRAVPPLPGQALAGPPAGPRSLAVAAGLLLGSVAAVVNLLALIAASASASAAESSPGLDLAAVALVLHVVLLAPVAEEVAFRGLLYRHFRGRLAPLLSTVGAALIFALMHAYLGQAVWAFFMGLVTAVAYEQTRTLVTPMLVHGLFNAVPVGVAVVRARPEDPGPLMLVLLGVALAFTLAAHRAGRNAERSRR